MMKNASFDVNIPRFYYINAGAQLVLSSTGFHIPSIRRRVFGHVQNAALKSSAVFSHIRVCVLFNFVKIFFILFNLIFYF